MSADHSNAAVRPPVAWALAFFVGLGLDWLYPLPFMPRSLPSAWIGAVVFAIGFALAMSAIVMIRRAGSRVETTKPTTAVITDGPFRLTRNPIYLGMLLGQAGLAAMFDSLWLVAGLALLYLIIRYGVIAREETYLEGKFGDAYADYRSKVRRWL